MVITSVGAKSGKLRKNPVMRVEKDGTYVAIASKGGARQPELVRQLRRAPVVDLPGRPEPKTGRRIAEGEERQQWWDHAVATWPTYASYQGRPTGRSVFLLRPLGD